MIDVQQAQGAINDYDGSIEVVENSLVVKIAAHGSSLGHEKVDASKFSNN
ncbi:MAG: hypothetical protein AseanaTS_09850 [Candidatus Pelagadaptatus aseana]